MEALIGLGALVQGLCDARFEGEGVDEIRPSDAPPMRALLQTARAVLGSWDSGFAPAPTLPRLDMAVPDQTLTLKQPEGYAFYALYPEGVALAARALRLQGPPRVIGIRSIGTSLGAMAAAALDTDDLVTVRPVGHPFDRRLAIGERLARQLLAGAPHYVVVDEGPGLSGSSFGAVAGWLEGHGVPPGRIAFLPSHGGDPGGMASEGTRARWAAAQRPVVPIATPARVRAWVETVLGPLDGSLADMSGGRWRTHRYPGEGEWPAVQPATERLKFLAVAGGRRFLVKFAGLGREGRVKLELAERLAASGWTPRPVGLAHGFLVQPWVEGGVLRPRAVTCAEADAVGRYLADRVQRLPPTDAPGATPDALLAMIRHNVSEALGHAAAERLCARLSSPREVRPVAIDGRMDAAEWIVSPADLLKADALDHGRAHDLIGGQDIAWDVSGARVELGLGRRQRSALLAAMSKAGVPIDPAASLFWMAAYLAFRLGQTRMTLDGLGNWPAEAARNHLRIKRYTRLLQAIST